MATKSTRFVSRPTGDLSSELFRRNPTGYDEEGNTAPVRQAWRPSWLEHRPELSKTSTTAVVEEDQSAPKEVKKLGTFSGVFVPTTLNVLSILMFLRFGFILGQGGILGTLGMLVASYLVCLITTLSISAISSNGTVRGGGAYYLISRSLGPEFGGSIGLVFYLGCVFNTGLNAVGMVDCLVSNFGLTTGSAKQFIPEEYWWRYLYATAVLVFCTIICLLGSSIFAKASNMLLIVLLLATFAIPLSALVVEPFYDPRLDIIYTGLSMKTFKENLMPHFTKGAAGSQIPGRENFQNLFGILFPACSGIFAGASMSGDLKHPSKAIPKGTLSGLALTFLTYSLVILSMGATIPRESLYKDLNIIQNTNISSKLILGGEFATSFFSALMGVIGSAKSLQALARDNIIPGFSVFGQGTKAADEPIYAILFTYFLSQLTLLCDINQIASFITMTYLMTFLATNLACFLLKIGSAPNFRPRFRYFTWWTAASGAIASGMVMFFVDGLYATGCVGVLLSLFLIIHYTTPPKSWGDVSQSLIYHQVRKYLLRLKQEHVKFWRPQILLLVNDPRNSWKLIQFCNAMKKGALYVLGHIIVTNEFEESFSEVKRQQAAWMKYIDFSKIKAFVQIAIAPTIEWGARNIVLSAGLGGMRPNITIMGFYNMDEYRKSLPLIDLSGNNTSTTPGLSKAPSSKGGSIKLQLQGQLPTDSCRPEKAISVQSYVNILEDLLLSLQINMAVAKGFDDLELPQKGVKGDKKYIDLWPIQMFAEIENGNNAGGNVLTTNFDTYTLILQLGCILHTVPAWKKAYEVRVIVFVEYQTDVREEHERVKKLLENLRIDAKVLVLYLGDGKLKNYETIINGSTAPNLDVERVLGQEEWWKELQRRRNRANTPTNIADISTLIGGPEWPMGMGSYQRSGHPRLKNLSKMFRAKKRHTISGLNRLGMPFSMSMRTHRLHTEDLLSESESSDDVFSDGSDSESEGAASEGDIDDYNSVDREPFRLQKARRASTGDALSGFGGVRSRTSTFKQTVNTPLSRGDYLMNAGPGQKKGDLSSGSSIGGGAAGSIGDGSSSTGGVSLRPPLGSHRISSPSFSSKAIPNTQISTDEGGPSIGFSTQQTTTSTTTGTSTSTTTANTPYHHHTTLPTTLGSESLKRSIEGHSNPTPNTPTTATAGSSSPKSRKSTRTTTGGERYRDDPHAQGQIQGGLSFNDLPAKGQHLILNELIKQYSRDTAVVFTTLPSPEAGTHKSEKESLEYLIALEVLTDELPPTLMVHSNSLTVTTAL